MFDQSLSTSLTGESEKNEAQPECNKRKRPDRASRSKRKKDKSGPLRSIFRPLLPSVPILSPYQSSFSVPPYNMMHPHLDVNPLLNQSSAHTIQESLPFLSQPTNIMGYFNNEDSI